MSKLFGRQGLEREGERERKGGGEPAKDSREIERGEESESRNVSLLVLHLVNLRCFADNVRECPFLGL